MTKTKPGPKPGDTRPSELIEELMSDLVPRTKREIAAATGLGIDQVRFAVKAAVKSKLMVPAGHKEEHLLVQVTTSRKTSQRATVLKSMMFMQSHDAALWHRDVDVNALVSKALESRTPLELAWA